MRCALFYQLLFCIRFFTILYRFFLKLYRSFLFLYPWLPCFVSLEDPNVYMLKFLKYFSLLKFRSILIRKNEDVRNNPWNCENPWFRNYLQEICHKNNHVRQNTSVTHEACHYFWINLCWKLGAQQTVVWIRIYRINHNVAG